MISESLLRPEELAAYRLRALYGQYGYRLYRMATFEDYDLCVRNRDFLTGDRFITFTDAGGRLMALKPDITLSVIRSGDDKPGIRQKLCYNENVFRPDRGSGAFREIPQAGLECTGDLTEADIFEVVTLAAKSLSLISDESLLDLSHLGLLGALLDGISPDGELRREVARCIATKNTHDLALICRLQGIGGSRLDEIVFLAGLYGPLGEVLPRLEPYCESPAAVAAFAMLARLSKALEGEGLAEKVRFNFAVINDMNYYNGIVFRGFVRGISEGILSGGQYDPLMRRMGRQSGGIGFALRLDLLEELPDTPKGGPA